MGKSLEQKSKTFTWDDAGYVILLIIFITGIVGMNNDIKTLQETIDSIKPVDDCAWLEPDRKRGAVIYNRFDSTITIQCKEGEK